MTREEITITGDAVSDQLTMRRVDFIRLREADRALAAAAEREACARICDAYGMPDGTSETARVLAAAIRGWVKPEPDAIARAVEAERRACAEYDDVLRLAQTIREAGGSKFPTGASAAASGEDRHKIARAGHLMREIRDALRRTDPAWCALNCVQQISDEELEELIARVEDAVEDRDGKAA